MAGLKDNLETDRQTWYNDYIRMTDDSEMIWPHFIKDFLIQHRLRYMVYFKWLKIPRRELYAYFVSTNYIDYAENMGLNLKQILR